MLQKNKAEIQQAAAIRTQLPNDVHVTPPHIPFLTEKPHVSNRYDF